MSRLPALFIAVLLLSSRLFAQTATVTATPTLLASSGGSVTVSVELSFDSSVSAIGLEFRSLPAAWSYGTAGGANPPQLTPRTGDTTVLDFVYLNVPASPARFTFTLNYPAGLTGSPSLSGIVAIFRNPANQQVNVPAITFTTMSAGGGGPITSPVVVSPPMSLAATAGAAANLSVTAHGTAPLSYQWLRDGTAVAGATSSVLSFASVSLSDAGSYTVRITNVAGTVTSSAGVLSVAPAVVVTAPQITAPPQSATAAPGGSASFSVTVTGSQPLTYQWRKDGAALVGATASTLTLHNLQLANAGAYSVSVTNAAGSVTSIPAQLVVSSTATPNTVGAFFGTFDGGRGSFALHLRADGSGTFLGYVRDGSLALVNRAVTVDATGRFRAAGALITAAASTPGEPARAAASTAYTLEGTIGSNRVASGTLTGLNLTLTGTASAASGSTAALAGFYQAGAVGRASTLYSIVGPAGDVFLLTDGASADAGRGSIDPAGALSVTTDKSARVIGSVQGSGMLTATASVTGSAALTFHGANRDTRPDTEKLVNLSTRSPAGGGDRTLIAGFFLAGQEPVSMLIRAIGPTLTNFGVTGALARPRLQVFRGNAAIGSNDRWGTAANAAAIASTATRVGAFELPAASADAALLITLDPGAYTAVVSGEGDATGVGLVEMYDAGVTGSPRKLVNLSARAQAGAGDDSLIAGFVIDGTVPKRVLVRGIGPALTAFGIAGALARLDLAVLSGNTVLAQNTGWSSSADARAIEQAAVQVGAFPLTVGAPDSAILVHLSPGPYTARISGTAGATGVALVEVYEVP
jgi:hypothetical protein